MANLHVISEYEDVDCSTLPSPQVELKILSRLSWEKGYLFHVSKDT